MLATRHLTAISVLLISGLCGTKTSVADVLVVCPERFAEAIQPWIDYRTDQGYKIVRIPSQISARKLKGEIKKRNETNPLEAILLVGDVPSADDTSGIKGVPTHYRKAEIIAPYAGDQSIATDNPYGDFDGDDVPEIPVGRFSVDQPRDLNRLITRTIDYESNDNFSSWRRQINLVAGVGRFGPLIDSMIESSTKTFLVTKIPAAYQTSMTQANWQSPFCPDPRQFRRTVIGRFNEGCLFWIYLGHGHVHTLDRLQVPDGAYPIFEYQDAAQLDAAAGSPIALLFCCYAAAYDAPDDCLAEAMLRSKGGPVAILGGSRTTMPYAMTALGDALMDEYFRNRSDTLGEALVQAKRKIAAGAASSPNRIWIDRIAGLLGSSESQRNAERHEHIQLFNLLGDPLLKLFVPESVKITAPRIVKQGATVSMQIDTPISGEATIELIVRRGTLRKPALARNRLDFSNAQLEQLQEDYLRANDQQLAQKQRTIRAGTHAFHLQLPDDFVGPAHARIYIQGADNFAMGSADIYVDRPSQP